MADMRTLREKLEAMAARGTPPEQEIARAKLAGMGPPPPRPPAPPSAAPMPEPSWTYRTTTSANFWWDSGTATYYRMTDDPFYGA